MELTQEYFDKKLEGLATKEDLKSFAAKEDLKALTTKQDLIPFATKDDLKGFATKDDLKGFATKDDLKAQTTELKAFAQEQTDALARIIATSVAIPLQAHLDATSAETDTLARITTLEHDVIQIKQALHISSPLA